MDTSEVEKFFALWKEDDQEKGETLKVRPENIIIIIIFL